MPSMTGGHHIALTVTDADRSAEWYSGLLGMPVVLSGDDETVKFRVLADPGSGWVLGVRQYHGREGDGFDEFRTGLDHFAFRVESLAASRSGSTSCRREESSTRRSRRRRSGR